MLEKIKDLPSRILLLPILLIRLCLDLAIWIHGICWPKYKDPRRGIIPIFIPIVLGVIMISAMFAYKPKPKTVNIQETKTFTAKVEFK